MRTYFKIFLSILLVLSFSYPNGSKAASEVNINISDSVLTGVNTGVGTNISPIMINYAGNYYSANMIENPSFEGRFYGNTAGTDGSQRVATGFTSPWHASENNWPGNLLPGQVTGAIDTSTKVSGTSSQKIHIEPAVTDAVDIEQWTQSPTLVPDHTYRVKLQVKGAASTAKIVLSVANIPQDLSSSPDFNISNNWQIITYDFKVPSTENLAKLNASAIRFFGKGDFWVDDFILWDIDDTTPEGINSGLVRSLREMHPKILRWGSLYANVLTLPRVTFRPWSSSYGPPPDNDIATFLELCRLVGAEAYITIPPSFNSQDFQANVYPQLVQARDNTATYGCVSPYNTELQSLMNQVKTTFEEHLQLLDYIGGDPGGTHTGIDDYAQIRQGQGLGKWDATKVSYIYFEYGNELWNTMSSPYYMWDCFNYEANYGQYVLNRVRAMKNYVNWKTGYYEAGFNGHWANSGFDTGTAQVIGQAGLSADKSIDFFSDTIYTPWPAEISLTTPDEQYFSALMASGTFRLSQLQTRKSQVNQAVGKTLKWIAYESCSEVAQDSNGNSDLAYKAHSIGATVALLDTYAKMQEAGINDINYFTAVGALNSVYATTYGYPNYQKLVQYYGLKMFNMLPSNRLSTTSTGGGSWNDTLLPQTSVPYVEGYGYKTSDSNNYYALVINRDRTNSHSITINFPTGKNYSASAAITSLVSKSTTRNINDNNDTASDIVTLETTSVTTSGNSYSYTALPYSATIIHFAVGSGASVQLTKSVDKISANPGQILTYTINYENTGTVTVIDPVINDNIPGGTVFVSAQNNGTYDPLNNKINWNLGNLAVGVSGNLSFQVRIR